MALIPKHVLIIMLAIKDGNTAERLLLKIGHKFLDESFASCDAADEEIIG